MMETIPRSDDIAPPTQRGASSSRRAFLLLRTVFTVAPIVFGLDKFANLLTDWPHYAPKPGPKMTIDRA